MISVLHVAGLASLGLPGFLHREKMPGMAGIAGRKAETGFFLFQFLNLRLAF